MSLAKVLKPAETEQLETGYGEVRNWLKGLDTEHAVISSEYFSACNPARLQETLSNQVPDHADSARIIAYVRPHHSRFLAAYIQRIKTGVLFADIETFWKKISTERTLLYARRFGDWRATFDDRFTLRPFLRPELRKQDAVIDFVSELLGEQTPFTLSAPIETNVSVPLHTLAGIRMMQKRFRKAGIGSFGCALMGNAMANHFLPLGALDGEKPSLDRAIAQALTDRFRNDAAELDGMFFDKPLMQQSLETAITKVVEEPIDLNPSRYFEPEHKAQIAALSDEIATLFRQKPELWSLHHRMRKRQIELSEEEKQKLILNRAHLYNIDDKMTELADLLRDRG